MSNNHQKKVRMAAMKDIILQLHKGLSVEEAKERFEKEVGDISSYEIAAMEQSLIDEGLKPEEIKKFCNVHALLFQSSLEKAVREEFFAFLHKWLARRLAKVRRVVNKGTC